MADLDVGVFAIAISRQCDIRDNNSLFKQHMIWCLWCHVPSPKTQKNKNNRTRIYEESILAGRNSK